MKLPYPVRVMSGSFILLCLASIHFALNGISLELNESQILYLSSASSQVIAAIFGLTLTGYVFFQNELNRREKDDDTLTEVIDELKERFYNTLVFIGIIVFVAILFSNLAMAIESMGYSRLTALSINIAQSGFIVALTGIIYFVYDILAPDRTETASNTMQAKYDPNANTAQLGSLENFLISYNEIEQLLFEYGQNFLTKNEQNTPQRKFPNSRLATILYKNSVISEYLFGKLRNLISLRNAIIHGAQPVVSIKMEKEAKLVLEELKKSSSPYMSPNNGL